jgi:hypothetical protein
MQVMDQTPAKEVQAAGLTARLVKVVSRQGRLRTENDSLRASADSKAIS